MINNIELIYCADGNKDYAQIAIDAKFVYGAQPTKKTYHPIEFADLDPKDIPPKDMYMAALKLKNPHIATVADWTNWEQLPTVLEWAEEAAMYVETIIIIPKVVGGVNHIPSSIGNKPIRLGFSYPTEHGKADWDILYEMIGWKHGIHVLGGPPQAVLALSSGRFKMPRRKARQPDMLTTALDIRSADGNYILFLANKGLVWRGNQEGTWVKHVSLKETNNGQRWGDRSNTARANYEAFHRSCENVMAAWKGQVCPY